MKRIGNVSLGWVVTAIALTLAALGLGTYAPRAQTQGCVGDCNGNDEVTINELLLMVNIALGTANVSQCPVGDANSDGTVAINEILAAVNSALRGCGEDTVLAPGLRALANADLFAAAAAFSSAAAAEPGNTEARLYARLTGAAARVLDDSDLPNVAERAGVTGRVSSRNVCDMEIGSLDHVPPGAPRSGEILTALRTGFIPELQSAVDTLHTVSPDTRITFRVTDLPECLRPDTDSETVEIDRGDLLLLEAALEGTMGLLDLLDGYNTDAALNLALEEPPQVLFANERQLLTLKAKDRLASARQHLGAAAAAVVGAIDSVGAETDNQADDLFVIDPDDQHDAREARLLVAHFEDSLSGEVSVPIDIVTGVIDLTDSGAGPHERLNLSRLFSGQLKSLRAFLPAFDTEGYFDSDRFPDMTFGGIVPDMTREKAGNFLVGGPPCAVCERDADCDALGRGEFYCGYCVRDCTGAMQRCVMGYDTCQDGTFD